MAGRKRDEFGRSVRAAERRAADQRTRDAADALLDDEGGRARLERAMTGASVRVQSYSDRNRAMLFVQAEQRGMSITDVATYRQWAERGRQVRKGETALRIVAPKGKEDREAGEETGNAGMGGIEPDQEADGDGKQGGESTRFRMVSLFDLSQTDEMQADDDAVTSSDTSAGSPAKTLPVAARILATTYPAGALAGPDWDTTPAGA